MTSSPFRSPHGDPHDRTGPGREPPPPAPPPPARRPAVATAAAVFSLCCGTLVTGAGGYGTVCTVSWLVDAAPGEERAIAGALGMAGCVLAMAIGTTIGLRGRGLLRGHPDAAGGLLHLFGMVMVLSGVGTAFGLFGDSLPAEEWRARLTALPAVFAVSLAGVLLCGARRTQAFAPDWLVRPDGTGR
ncbi:hypothetical protein [Streptomyces sp. NPDC018031]|uniref:hypothetical protein n=1 Tax=Streptomyces sp. NPDC018031 TaxID=3365033 RepID=UPI00379DD287